MTRIVQYRPWGLRDSAQSRWGDPFWSPLSRLHTQMNRLFEDTFQRDEGEDRGFNPSLDVDQEEDHYEITVELPGVRRSDVKVEVRDDRLVISGSKQESQKSDTNERVHNYRRYGSFQQTLSLPDDVDRDAISANFCDGVLTVKIPRDAELQRDRVRQIDVTERADDRNRQDAGTNESGIDVEVGPDASDRRKAARAGSQESPDSEELTFERTSG